MNMNIKTKSKKMYICFMIRALAVIAFISLSCRPLRADGTKSVTAEIPIYFEADGAKEALCSKVPDGFTAVIEADGNTAGRDVETPMPGKTSYVFYGDGERSFEIEYVIPGDYRYRIYQKESGVSDIKTDDTVYEVTVRVVNSAEGGLEYEIWANVLSSDSKKVERIVFKNHFFEDTDVKTGDPGCLLLTSVFVSSLALSAVFTRSLIKSRRIKGC